MNKLKESLNKILKAYKEYETEHNNVIRSAIIQLQNKGYTI